MISAYCEKAINDALSHGNAILKFISPNDVGATGGHQCGFYMPKSAWELFTPYPPEKGSNTKHDVNIEWQNGEVTNSVVTWYGQGTRSEYRLTRFGRGFQWLIPDTVGDLLVLIPKSQNEFLAYVLDLEEDISEVMAALGVQPFEHWAVYRNGAPEIESEDECIAREINEFAKNLKDFPSGQEFSDATIKILEHCCNRVLEGASPDEVLMECYETEYKLFQTVERLICQKDVARLFKDIDDFLKTASSIMNRRKSRAGRSLENHVDFVLSKASIPHKMQPDIDGNPDVVIPSEDAYKDTTYPKDKLFIVGIKTTCKDRWRQVLNEGKKVEKKHILTLQPGISVNQLNEMHEANVTLVIPKRLRKDYPADHPIEILDIETFIEQINSKLSV